MQIVNKIAFPDTIMHSIGTFFSNLDCFTRDCLGLFGEKSEYDLQYFGR